MSLGCKAQEIIVPLQNDRVLDWDLIDDNEENVYLKDVNNDLNKFVGTWKVIHNGRDYEFRIWKYTDSHSNDYFFKYKRDMLYMRHIIKDVATSNTIESSINTKFGDPHLINGVEYYSANTHRFFYIGQEGNCGQLGDIFIDSLTANTIKLSYSPSRTGFISGEDCPNGLAVQHMPEDTITLTKQ